MRFGVTHMVFEKKRFLNEKAQDSAMHKKEGQSAMPGIASLSQRQLKEYEGKCVGIVDGKAVFAHEKAAKVLEELNKYVSPDKVFTCVPKGNVTLVK